MTSVSNAAVGAFLAGNAAAKARHGMNEAIARLSTGVRSSTVVMRLVHL